MLPPSTHWISIYDCEWRRNLHRDSGTSAIDWCYRMTFVIRFQLHWEAPLSIRHSIAMVNAFRSLPLCPDSVDARTFFVSSHFPWRFSSFASYPIDFVSVLFAKVVCCTCKWFNIFGYPFRHSKCVSVCKWYMMHVCVCVCVFRVVVCVYSQVIKRCV